MFDPRRWIYAVAMYTGLRAAHNRWRNRRGAPLRLAAFDGVELPVTDTEVGVMRVHRRRLPATKPTVGPTGMMAISLKSPGTRRWLYRWLCLTSHFGTGHVELAFVEHADGITFYAVRNIVRSNLERIAATRWFPHLKLKRDRDDVAVLLHVADWLRHQGIATSFAPAQECVAYSVDSFLVKPGRLPNVQAAMERRYRPVIKAWLRFHSTAFATQAESNVPPIRSIISE